MKRLIILSALFFMLSAASYSQPSFFVSLGSGIVTPTGVLSDDNITGFNLNGSTGYLFNSNIGARTDFQYNSFSLDTRRFPGATGGRLSIVAVKTDLMAGNFDKAEKVNPYGVLGLGYYMSTRSDIFIDGDRYTFQSSNDFGVGLGGGIMYNISSKVLLYGEVQYNNIFAADDNITFIPIRAGIVLRP